MSFHINSDKEKIRGVAPKLIGDNELTIRGGIGALEREILRTELDVTTNLPRVGINRTGERINNIDVVSGGSGYTTQPSVEVGPPQLSGGITAQASAFIFNGQVVSIAVNNPGSGYNAAPTVTLSGGGGTGATATAFLDTVDFELDINGAIRTSTSIISDTARILNLDIDNFITPDANFRGPNLKTYANNTGTPWAAGVIVQKNAYRYFGANMYQAINSGQTGASAPDHKDGIVLNGEVQFKHIGFRVVDPIEYGYNETGESGVFPRSITPLLGDRSDKIATTEYVLNLATNDVGGRVYVSSQIGSDLNDGRSAVNPVRTIKKACQLAWSTPGVKETIIVSGGDYVEDNPVSIPPDASIVGDNLRLVIIRPANPGKHIFKFGDKNYVLGVTFRDKIDSNNDPVATWDYAMVFDDKQRITIDAEANGDFGVQYPIGTQVFGPDQFRVSFQQNTGLSNLATNLEVVGVNTGARAKVIDVNFDTTIGASAYVNGTIDVRLTSGSFVEGERFEYITSASTDAAIGLTISQTAGANKLRFTQDPSGSIPAGTYVKLDDTNDAEFTEGFYQVVSIDNTNAGSGYWDVTFVPILNSPTWSSSNAGNFTINASTPVVYTIDTTAIKSIRAEGEVVEFNEDYSASLPITRIDFSLQGDASIATGGFQNAQFGNAEEIGGIVFYTSALVGRTNTHEFKEGQEILLEGLPTSGPDLSELNGKQRIYKVIEDADGRARRFVIPKKMPAVTDANLDPGQFATVKSFSKTVTLSLLNSPNTFPLATPTNRRYQDACLLIRNNVDYIADEAVGKLNSQFAKDHFSVFDIGGTAASQYTPTGATYDPATGDVVFTLNSHGLSNGTGLRITDDSLTFTCAMDNNATEHSYPRSTDPASTKALPIIASDANTFTVNVGLSPSDINYTPSGGTYNPATGDLTLTISSHALTTGESIIIEDESLHFKCAMDNNQVTKKYPRASDKASGRSLPITGTTASSVTVNVGVAGVDKTFTPTNGTFDPLTGNLVLTIGQHGIRVGDDITIDNSALTFTCGMDGNATTHSYPRQGSDPVSGQSIPVIAVGSANKTATNAAYNPSTGLMTITVANHGYANGDYIKIADGSLTFQCALDSNGSNHAYPRAGYDPTSGRWLLISNVQTNTFDVNVGIAQDTSVHTFVSASADGIARQDGTLTVNVGTTPHVAYAPTAATYTPTTGALALNIGAHNINIGDSIRLEEESVKFTCLMDGNQVEKLYPRSAIDLHTATNAAYNPQTGTLTLTIVKHGMSNGDFIKIADDSLTFRCDQDGQASDHTYPRAADPVSGEWIPVSNVTEDTVTVQVLDSAPSTNTSTHVFQSASANGISQKRDRAFEQALNVDSIGFTAHTVTNAVYTPATGVMVLTVAGHGFSNGDHVKLSNNSLTFTCAKDGNATTHSYPRTGDPVGGDWIKVSQVTTDTFEVNVGTSSDTSAHTFVSATTGGLERQDGIVTVNVGLSPEVTYTPTDASYTPATGLLELTIGEHNLRSGTGVRLTDNAVTFTCAQDSDQTNHSYPRPLIDSHTATNATYNPVTGILTLTVAGHGIRNGDWVKIEDNSLTLNCTMDGNASNKTYPRSTDPISGQYVLVSNVSTDTFDINVGASPIVNYQPTDIDYNPTTGIMEMTIGSHNHIVGDSIKFAANSLTFTCAEDGNGTQHTYPRSTDPFYDTACPITAVTATTISVQVLTTVPSTNVTAHTFVSATANAVQTGGNYAHTFVSAATDGIKQKRDKAYNTSINITAVTNTTITLDVGISSNTTAHTFVSANANSVVSGGNHAHTFVPNTDLTPTDAAYNPTTGVMTLTIANHGLANGEHVRIADSALTFTCAEDGNGSNHSYPRPTDPVSGKFLKVSNVQTNTFDVQVLDTTPSTNTTAHTFVSAVANSVTRGVVRSGGDYAHTWVSGAANSVKITPQSLHTFVSADTNAVRFRPQTAHTFKRASANSLGTGGSSFKIYLGQTPETHTYVSGGTVEFGGTSYNVSNFVYDNIGTGYATVTVSAAIPNIAEDSTVKLANILVSCTSGQKLYPSFSPPTSGNNTQPNGDENCRQDIRHFLNAVQRDLEFGSNHNVIEAAKKYIVGAKIDYIENEIIQTVRGIEYARELAIYAMCNWRTGNRTTSDPLYVAEHTSLTQYTDQYIVNFGATAGSPACDDVRAAIDTLAYLFVDVISNNASNVYLDAAYLIGRNRDLIADQALKDTEANYPNANLSDLNQRKCRRDINLVLGGLIRDLVLGGNTGIVEKAELYFTGTELSGIEQAMLAQTVFAYQRVKYYVIKALSNWSGSSGTHTFVSGTTNGITPNAGGTVTAASGTTYDPATGALVLEIGSHSLTTSNTLQIANGAVTFTCEQDGNVSQKTYPRANDPFSGANLAISAVTATTVTVNVGVASTLPAAVTPNGASYTANTGVLTVTFPDPTKAVTTNHRLAFKEDALTFTCDQDSNATQHTYPRRVPADKKAYGKSLPITNVSSSGGNTTVTVNVGAAGSASGSTHAFVSGATNGCYVVYDQISTSSPIPKFEDWNITLFTGGTPLCSTVASTVTTEMELFEDILDGTTAPGTTTKTTGTLYDTSLIITYPDSYIYDSQNQRSAIRGDYDDYPIIEASPYTQNSSVISFLGGNGAFVDGAKVKQPNCPFAGLELDGTATYPNQGKSMVASAFTIVSFGGIGYRIINDGYVQLVSVFVIFCADGVLAESGGYASITNSATNFGQYALRGIGYSDTPYTFDIATITNVSSTPTGRTILTVSGLGREPLEHYVVKINGYTNTNTAIEYFVDVVSAVTVGPPFSAQLTIDDGTGGAMDLTDVATGNAVSTSVLVGKTINLHRPSIVNSSSHTWEFAGSGTNYLALPENGGTKIEANEQVSQNYGRVYVSGTDELGDFKVGTFARIENRTGNITFTGTVTISEVEFLKLKGGDVVVTGFDDSNTLGGAQASDSKLPTQKAVRDYITNSLGPYINKPYSTNAVPRALVELTDSGKISIDQIPALRPFQVYTVASQAERLKLEGALAGDICIQQDTSQSFILNNDLTSLFLGFQYDAALNFTIGDIFVGSISTGRIQSTEYRQGVVYQINVTNSGSGYTVAPAVTFSGGNPGGGAVSASATCTIANGEVVTVTIVEFNGFTGGKGYTTAPTVTFAAPPGAGTQATGVSLIESRLYGDIVNNVKIEDTDTFDDSTTPSATTVTINRVVNTSATLNANWVSLSSNQIAASDITSGVIETDRLASGGAANSFTFLRGDQNFALAVQSLKGAETRYFAQLHSQATSGTSSLIFLTNQNALIGHEVKNTINGIQANTNITGVLTTGGLTTVSINNPVTQTIAAGTIIEFERGDSPMTFESTYTQGNFVDDVIISNGGSGYTNGQYFDIPLTGGSGTGLKANIVVTANAVSDVTVTDGGSGYSADFAITVAPSQIGTGSGLVLEAKVSTVSRQYANVALDVQRVTDQTISADLYGTIGVGRYKKAQFNIGTAGNGSVELKTGADSGLDADLLDGAQGAFYLNSGNQNSGTLPTDRLSGTYNISISGSSQNTIRLITGTNNPTSNPTPNNFVEGIIANTVFNSANGLTDGGTRNLLMTIRNGGSGFDATYGGVRQLAFTDNDNMWIRGSGTGVTTFGSWGKVWTSLNDGVDSDLDADRLDNRQGDWYQNALNINSGNLSDNRLPEFISPKAYQDRLVVKSFLGDPKYAIYVQGLILNSSPFSPGNAVNLYNANAQAVGSFTIDAIAINDDVNDNFNDYSILSGRLTSGNFTGALTIGTASNRVPFQDFTIEDGNTFEVTRLESSSGTALLKLGRTDGTATSPAIYFRSSASAASNFNASIVASGGTSTDGSGTLNIQVVNADGLSINGATAWNAGNITFQSQNIANTAVKRDASGNFAAGTITASITGASSLNVLKTGDTMTGTLNISGGSSNLSVGGTAGITGVTTLGNDLNVDSGALFVDASANEVGINAGINPLSTLDVVGNDGIYIRTTTNASGDGARIRFSDHVPGGAPTQVGQLKYHHSDAASPNSEYGEGFTFFGSEPELYLRVVGDIIASRNIGININREPDYNLEVEGSTFTRTLYIDTANDNSGAPIYFKGSSSQRNFRIGNQIGWSNAFEITPSTNNGGTTWDSTPGLLVTGDRRVTINTSATSGTDPQNNQNRNYYLNVQGDMNINGQLFQNNSEFVTSRWTQASNGNDIYRLSKVGVNKSNPTYEMHISGKCNIEGQNFSNQTNDSVLYANGDRQWIDTYGVFKCNRSTVSENITVPNNHNCMSAGPITVNNNIVVTIASGGSWVVI